MTIMSHSRFILHFLKENQFHFNNPKLLVQLPISDTVPLNNAHNVDKRCIFLNCLCCYAVFYLYQRNDKQREANLKTRGKLEEMKNDIFKNLTNAWTNQKQDAQKVDFGSEKKKELENLSPIKQGRDTKKYTHFTKPDSIPIVKRKIKTDAFE